MNNNKGSALIEFAVSLLFFIPVIIGLIDICIMLTNYQKLEQAVREGVRTASRLPQLTGDFTFVNHDFPSPINMATLDANVQACRALTPPPPSAALDCGHVLIHSRVRAVVRHERVINMEVVPRNDPITGLPVAFLTIQSLFCPLRAVGTPPPTGSDCPGGIEDDTILIRAFGSYNGFFGTWPLTATYQGPWLFQNVATN